MELNIVSEIQGDVLVVTVNGRVSYAPVLRLFKEVFDRAAANRVNRILVNCLVVDGELAPSERYRLGTELAGYLIQNQMKLKLALVGKPPAVNGFGMRIARNRGITADVFRSRKEALNWLDSPDPEDLAAAAPDL